MENKRQSVELAMLNGFLNSTIKVASYKKNKNLYIFLQK